MSLRRASLAFLVLSLSIALGCKKKPQPPPPPPEEPKPKVEPKVEPPKPVPKSDGPVQLALPEQPAAEPWVVGRAPDASQWAAVTIAGVTPQAMTGLAVRPAVNRAVATCRLVAKKEKTLVTRVVLCDTAAGKIHNEWQIPGDYAVLDLSPDGRSILATGTNSGRERRTLRVWLLTSDNKIKRWSFDPHEMPPSGAPATDSGRKLTDSESVEVRWAAFVGNDRIVSVSWAGQLRVWNPDGPKLLATIDATRCRPAVTPDGTRVAFLAGEVVALLDPTALRVTDVRPVGPPPPYPVLAFNPDGTKLAIGGNGRVSVLELATGAVRRTTLPKLRVTDNGVHDHSFAWAGNDYLYADQQLHDPNFPLPVWQYRGAEQTQTRGTRTWLSVNDARRYTSTVRPVTLPHMDLQGVVAAAKASPERFALKPGDRVRIDVSGVPAERQAEVKAALETRLKEVGYVPDEGGPATLRASVDVPGIKSTVTYVAGDPDSYVRHPAKLELILLGKELWSEAWSAPPPLWPPNPQKGEKMEKCLERLGAGAPNYDLFRLAPIPAYVPAPTAPAVALGASDFTADGFKDTTARKQ